MRATTATTPVPGRSSSAAAVRHQISKSQCRTAAATGEFQAPQRCDNQLRLGSEPVNVGCSLASRCPQHQVCLLVGQADDAAGQHRGRSKSPAGLEQLLEAVNQAETNMAFFELP